MEANEPQLGVGTVASAARNQVILAASMLTVLGVGIWFHAAIMFGISNWLGRAGLVVVGMAIAADFLNNGYGWFNGTKAEHFWKNDDMPIAKSFSWILALGAIGGTLISAFADLWKVGA